jgi:hypothetical protein
MHTLTLTKQNKITLASSQNHNKPALCCKQFAKTVAADLDLFGDILRTPNPRKIICDGP